MEGDKTTWIQGDGGPAIVLQSAAVLRWQGASSGDDSLMRGGSVEDDYDVICRGEGRVHAIERYGRQMLVLDDSENATCFTPSVAGQVVIVQGLVSDAELSELVTRALARPASESFRFTVVDSVLRLLVGVDTGRGETYGYSEAPCLPGEKVCEVYHIEEVTIVVVRPANAAAADKAAPPSSPLG